MLGVAEFVPILLLALVGGALADAFDRRRLIALAEAWRRWSSPLGLVANALLGPPQRLGACSPAPPLSAAATRCGGRRWTRLCRGWSSATS